MKKSLFVIGFLFVMAVSAFGQKKAPYGYHFCYCSKDTVSAIVDTVNQKLTVNITIGEPGRIPLPGAKFESVHLRWFPGLVSNDSLWIPKMQRILFVDSLFKWQDWDKSDDRSAAMLVTSASESNDSTKTIIDETSFGRVLSVESMTIRDRRHCTLTLNIPERYMKLLINLPGLMTKEGALRGVEVFM